MRGFTVSEATGAGGPRAGREDAPKLVDAPAASLDRPEPVKPGSIRGGNGNGSRCGRHGLPRIPVQFARGFQDYCVPVPPASSTIEYRSRAPASATSTGSENRTRSASRFVPPHAERTWGRTRSGRTSMMSIVHAWQIRIVQTPLSAEGRPAQSRHPQYPYGNSAADDAG